MTEYLNTNKTNSHMVMSTTALVTEVTDRQPGE